MRHCLSLAFVAGCVALAGMTLSAPPAAAYETWSAGTVGHPAGSPRCRDTDLAGCEEPFGNCQTCHGHFRATDADNDRPMLRDEYVSPADGKTWREVYQEISADAPELEVGLHDIHRHIMVDKVGRSRCSVCHMAGGRYPVYLFMSAGAADGNLDPISCMGCHGRPGEGAAGLRQHHTNAGIIACKTCHEDADPANFTPAGENVLPAYYASANRDVFPNIPVSPCNAHGEEDFAAGPKGLDNDGDGAYDKGDLDCTPRGPGKNHGRR